MSAKDAAMSDKDAAMGAKDAAMIEARGDDRQGRDSVWRL